MSRYQVNKLLRVIAREELARAEFLKDPAGFITDADLTDAERKALIEKDFKTLYSLGVHSFLLFAFVMSVFPGDRRKLEEHYCNSIARLGRIDYST
jgi:hypothetical protein